MARTKATLSDVAQDTARTLVDPPQPNPPRPRRVKTILLGIALVSALGVLAFVMVRETALPSRTTRATPSQPSPAPPRPPLTAAEEAYAHALWPVHTDVKLSALRMMFAGINYKRGKIDRADLKARVDAENETFRRAAARIRTLAPPASLQEVHAYYVDALRLYQQAAAEMLKIVDDGRGEHLVAASPMVKEAGRNLEAVGIALWPGEYVPN